MFTSMIDKKELAKLNEALLSPDLTILDKLEGEKSILKFAISRNLHELRRIREDVENNVEPSQFKVFNNRILSRPELSKEVKSVFHKNVETPLYSYKPPEVLEKEIFAEQELVKSHMSKFVDFDYKGKHYDHLTAKEGLEVVMAKVGKHPNKIERKLFYKDNIPMSFKGVIGTANAARKLAELDRKHVISNIKIVGYKK